MECCSHLRTGALSLPKGAVSSRCTHTENEGGREVGGRERQTDRLTDREVEGDREKGNEEHWFLHQAEPEFLWTVQLCETIGCLYCLSQLELCFPLLTT